MPIATFTRVREVSSEDNVHLAENLIKSQSDKKWKTKNAGEKSAYVVLEMLDNYKITGIDIGNEHSAFVEVLVGKSCAPAEFKELLLTCSFMTPFESKSSNNINRVRCFNKDALVPTVAEEKWSLVKVLCTQPFNKHVSYGLSFIKVHINDDVKSSSIIQKNLVPEHVVGKLKFREESPDLESEKSSSLFQRWKKLKNDNEETAAASIRMASKHPMKVVPPSLVDNQISKTSLSQNNNILDRNRENLLFGNDNDDDMNLGNKQKQERITKQLEADKKRRLIEIEKEINAKKRKSLDSARKSLDKLSALPSNSKTLEESKNMSLDNARKRINSPPENPTKKNLPAKKFRPFNQLLKDVVLVISGIQNPDRGELRSKAVALGAKYKADWDNTCTHLICAFKNTPKYNQVKGKGKIVTRSWIEKCYSTRKYLPWRRYALDSIELSKPESDEEIFEEIDNCTDTSIGKCIENSGERTNTLALYDNDDRRNNNNLASNHKSSSSEDDTDDEIKKVEHNTKVVKMVVASKTLNIYEASTDEEDYLTEKLAQNK